MSKRTTVDSGRNVKMFLRKWTAWLEAPLKTADTMTGSVMLDNEVHGTTVLAALSDALKSFSSSFLMHWGGH